MRRFIAIAAAAGLGIFAASDLAQAQECGAGIGEAHLGFITTINFFDSVINNETNLQYERRNELIEQRNELVRAFNAFCVTEEVDMEGATADQIRTGLQALMGEAVGLGATVPEGQVVGAAAFPAPAVPPIAIVQPTVWVPGDREQGEAELIQVNWEGLKGLKKKSNDLLLRVKDLRGLSILSPGTEKLADNFEKAFKDHEDDPLVTQEVLDGLGVQYSVLTGAVNADRRQASNRPFYGRDNFGLGFVYTNRASSRTVNSASLDPNNVVRVDEDGNTSLRVVLEYHVIPETWTLHDINVARLIWTGHKSGDFGDIPLGVFVALQAAGTGNINSDSPLDALGFGLIAKLGTTSVGDRPIYLGAGAIFDRSAKRLGADIFANKELPAGEDVIRFETSGRWSLMIMVTFGLFPSI